MRDPTTCLYCHSKNIDDVTETEYEKGVKKKFFCNKCKKTWKIRDLKDEKWRNEKNLIKKIKEIFKKNKINDKEGWHQVDSDGIKQDLLNLGFDRWGYWSLGDEEIWGYEILNKITGQNGDLLVLLNAINIDYWIYKKIGSHAMNEGYYGEEKKDKSIIKKASQYSLKDFVLSEDWANIIKHFYIKIKYDEYDDFKFNYFDIPDWFINELKNLFFKLLDSMIEDKEIWPKKNIIKKMRINIKTYDTSKENKLKGEKKTE